MILSARVLAGWIKPEDLATAEADETPAEGEGDEEPGEAPEAAVPAQDQ